MSEIENALEILQSDGVVGLPTETVYGLAASIRSRAGIEKIFQTKSRPFFDPLIVHISDVAQIPEVAAEFSSYAKSLAEKFWPGPLTLILPRAASLNPMITAGLDTVGVRMPRHPIAREVIARLGVPLAAPSANQFGKTSPTTRAHVLQDFPELFVLEGGDCEIGIESTVVRISGEEKVHLEILRPGAITESDLRSVAEKWNHPFEILARVSNASPGYLEHHYEPEKPLAIVNGDENNLSSATLALIQKKLGIVDASYEIISLDEDPRIAARNLYSQLRAASKKNVSFLVIFRTRTMHGELWDGIWDRLTRAARVKV